MSASINISSQRRMSTARRTRLPARSLGIRKRLSRAHTGRITLPPRTIVRVVNPGEKKFFDSSFQTAVTASWNVFSSSLCIPAAGTGSQTRIGSAISIVSFHMSAFLQLGELEAQANPAPEILYRVIIGVARKGGTTTVADVLDTGATNQILAWRNLDETRNIRILKDFYVRLDPHALNEGTANNFANGTSNSQVIKFTHVFKKPLVLRFSLATTTITENSLFAMVIGTNVGSTLNMETRTRYTDS